jgi:hypothetical protein
MVKQIEFNFPIVVQPTDSLRQPLSTEGEPLTMPQVLCIKGERDRKFVKLIIPSFKFQIGPSDAVDFFGYLITIIKSIPKVFRHFNALPITFEINAKKIENFNAIPVILQGSIDRKGNLTISATTDNNPIESGIYDIPCLEVCYKIIKPKLLKDKARFPKNVLVDEKQSKALWAQGTFGALFDYGDYHIPSFIDGKFNFIWPANNPCLPDLASFPFMDVFNATLTKSKCNNIETLVPTTNVSEQPGTEAEGEITIDPTNPMRRVAVYQRRSFNRRGFFRSLSTDGGKTWMTDLLAFEDTPEIPRGGSDPHARFDDFGNCWVMYLGPAGANPDIPPIKQILLLSIDGGITFNKVDEIVPPNLMFPPFFGTDYGWLATGPDGEGGQVVWHGVSLTRVGPINPAILLTDSYVLRGTRIKGLGDFEPVFFQIDIPLNNIGGLAAFDIGSDGQIAVVFESNPQDQVDQPGFPGFNAGVRIFLPLFIVRIPKPFLGQTSDPQPIAIHDGGFPRERPYEGEVGFSIPAQLRRGLFATIQVKYDNSCGPNRGRVYVSFTDEIDPITNPGPTDVILIWSDDDGKTWSPVQKINNNKNPASTLLPELAVDDKCGDVGVAWLDTREDPTLQKTQIL